MSSLVGEGEIVFAKGQLPPLTDIGFWSITPHDENMQVKANEYDSYLLWRKLFMKKMAHWW